MATYMKNIRQRLANPVSAPFQQRKSHPSTSYYQQGSSHHQQAIQTATYSFTHIPYLPTYLLGTYLSVYLPSTDRLREGSNTNPPVQYEATEHEEPPRLSTQ